MVVVILAALTVFVMLCCIGSSRRASTPRPSAKPVARPSCHQIYATRIAPTHGSPWAHRVVVRGAR